VFLLILASVVDLTLKNNINQEKDMKSRSRHEPRRTKTFIILGLSHDAVLRVREEELFPFGLTHSQASTLHWINALGEKATPTEIARRQFRSPHSVGELLVRLRKAGLVERFQDLQNLNQVRYEMTKKGRDLFKQCQRLTSLRHVLSGLTNEEQEQLCDLLMKLYNTALKELGMRPKNALPYMARRQKRKQRVATNRS